MVLEIFPTMRKKCLYYTQVLILLPALILLWLRWHRSEGLPFVDCSEEDVPKV